MHGIYKTALFLSGLPEEASAVLLRKLEPETASKVRVEMKRLQGTPREKLRQTVAEFLDTINTTEQPQIGPVRRSPEKMTPANRIANTFDREVSDSGTFRPVPQTMESFSQGIDYLTLETRRDVASPKPVPKPEQNPASGGRFRFLEKLPAEQIRELLLFETPRIVAVLLTQLPPELAGQILEQLTEDARNEVVSILFELEEIDEEILEEIAAVLKDRAENIFGKMKKNIGYAAAKRILQAVDQAACRRVSAEIRNGNSPKRPFVFEDLQYLPDRGLREVFDSVDARTALLALVGAPQELIDRVFGKATPQQEKRMFRQYQSFAPIRQADVEAARQRLIENIQSSL